MHLKACRDAATQILGWSLVEDAGLITAGVIVGGSLFVLTPLFLVAYSVIWAWPSILTGDRAVIAGLSLFGVVVQAVSTWSWVDVQMVSLTTLVMRLLLVLSPIVFGACAVSADLAYRRATHSWSVENEAVRNDARAPGLDSKPEPGIPGNDTAKRGMPEVARRPSV